MHTCEEKDKLFTVVYKALMIWPLPTSWVSSCELLFILCLSESHTGLQPQSPSHAPGTPSSPLLSLLELISSMHLLGLNLKAASSQKPALICFPD